MFDPPAILGRGAFPSGYWSNGVAKRFPGFGRVLGRPLTTSRTATAASGVLAATDGVFTGWMSREAGKCGEL